VTSWYAIKLRADFMLESYTMRKASVALLTWEVLMVRNGCCFLVKLPQAVDGFTLVFS
jgi:hypothetical protein